MSERLIVGFHAVGARLRAHPDGIIDILVDPERQDGRMKTLVETAHTAGVQVRQLPKARLDGLVHHARHQGVIARVIAEPVARSLDDHLDTIKGEFLLLVLDGVTDPHNLGACLRVADAAGVNAVIAPKDRAVGIGTTVSRVAAGGAEVVPYFMVTNLARTLAELKERGIWIIGTDGEAQADVFDSALAGSIAWVMGAEGAGMRRLTRERCDSLVRIPMSGSVGSLNVSVASAICLFETVRQRRCKG